jgi:hypothetical protein
MSDPFFRVEGDLLVRRMPTAPVPFAVFEDDVPTRRQAKRILRLGYGLHLLGVPERAKSLQVLGMFEGLEHLGITGRELDLRPVVALSMLKSLSLHVIDSASADLSLLDRLEAFDGMLDGNESVMDCPRLTSATFEDVTAGGLPPIPAQLRELTLAGAQRVRGIAPGPGVSHLEAFHLVGARTFDLATLAPFDRLSFVSFQSVARLTHADALSRLPLATLGLFQCREVDPLDALASLGVGTSVAVAGRLQTKVADIAARSAATWHFPRSA